MRWWLSAGRVVLVFKTATGHGHLVLQNVDLTATAMPAGGSRRWHCPRCRRRAEAVYLPLGLDEVSCRKCHELKYESQYTRGRRTRWRRPRVAFH